MTRRNNGFTFVELLTVLFVLSGIAAAAFYGMSTFRRGCFGTPSVRSTLGVQGACLQKGGII